MHKMGPQGSKHHIFDDHFYSKNARKLRFHVLLYFNARKHISSFYLKWIEFTKIVNKFQFNSGPRGPTIGTKFTISCEFGPLPVKWWCHMFSNMKWKEYMEYELFGIFRVKVVAKNILFGFLGTQRQPVFSMWCLLKKQMWKKIYVNEKSFCLINWVFPLVGSGDPFHAVKLQKYFMHTRVKSSWKYCLSNSCVSTEWFLQLMFTKGRT